MSWIITFLVLIGVFGVYFVVAQEGDGNELNNDDEDNVINYIPQDGISIIETSTSDLRIPKHYTGEYRIVNQTGDESDYNITFEKVKSGAFKGYVLIELSSNSEVLGNLPLYKNKNKIKEKNLVKKNKNGKNVFSYYADPKKDFHLKFGEDSIIIIQISSAEHLDENREFISDIYDEVYELDGIWSEEIPNTHYVRITFEENLTSSNDITLYPNITSGNPTIEIYEKDGETKIAEFTNIISSEYNKVYLTNLQGIQDTFDLKIVGGSVEFDHIVDPSEDLFYEDWEAGNFDDWANSGWAIATDQAQGAKSAKCAGVASCDMYTSVSIDTSSATKVLVRWFFRDDDCDQGDAIIYVKDSGSNWDGWYIDAGSLGGNDDTWYSMTLTLTEAQHFHSGFSVRFIASPEDRENYWVDNVNVSANITISDSSYPQFSNYWDDNASLEGSGKGHFNVTVEDTNGTVLLDINGENITATNLTSNVYNTSYTFTSDGVYAYRWHSWGNGTEENYNKSVERSYTVNISYGWLNVSIQKPDDNSNWVQYDTNLTINATVTCSGEAGAKCGTVYALARYNLTANPNIAINVTKGANPFYVYGGTWWDSSFGKKKQINISENSGNSYTNFTTLIFVDYDSDMQSDFDDIRFVNSAEDTELDYWIENKTDGDSASVWVKCNLTASTNNTIYMYYNNTGASSNSNGTDTFMFFDEFDNLDQWTTVSGTWSVAGGYLHKTADHWVWQHIRSNTNITSPFVATYDVYEEMAIYFGTLFQWESYSESYSSHLYGDLLYHTGYSTDSWQIFNETSSYSPGLTGCDCWLPSRYHINSTHASMTRNNTNALTVPVSTNTEGRTGKFAFGTYEDTAGADIACGVDNITIRVYSPVEPTVYFGSEENIEETAENPRLTTLNQGDSWKVSWTLNVTSPSTESYLIDVFFNSSYGNSNVLDNDTENRQVNLNPAGDTCTPPVSGNWANACSDNCTWSTDVDIPANITMVGKGNQLLEANWTFTGSNQYIFINSGCNFTIGSGGEIT